MNFKKKKSSFRVVFFFLFVFNLNITFFKNKLLMRYFLLGRFFKEVIFNFKVSKTNSGFQLVNSSLNNSF